MSYRSIPAGTSPARHLNHALAALREAAECLEEASATGEPADVNVASALSHVAAARIALKPHGFGGSPRLHEPKAA